MALPDSPNPALLPAGLHDVLPPDAAHEAQAVERLMAAFQARGYERVKPPLVEFEDSLLVGSGAAMAPQSFRLMDPLSQRMMAVRADMTPQIARIAGSRLANAARPLRLCYAGQVLRVKGSQLRPERQFAQVGAELIGAMEAEADAEAVLLAAQALEMVGVRRPTVDLCVPTMVPLVCRGLGLDEGTMQRLRAALDRKDAAAVAAVGGPAAVLLETLMAASGPAAKAMRVLGAIDLPEPAEKDRRRLSAVMDLLRAAHPDLTVTIDLVEYRGFEYHTGVSFSLFARGVRGELGAGGRYRAGTRTGNGEPGEAATGFTLYMDTVLRAVPVPEAPRRLFLPLGTPAIAAASLRADGWVTVAGLARAADVRAEAARLGCAHALIDGTVTPVAS